MPSVNAAAPASTSDTRPTPIARTTAIVRVSASAGERPRCSSQVNIGAARAARNNPRPMGATTGASHPMRNSASPTITHATSVANRLVLPLTQRGTSVVPGPSPDGSFGITGSTSPPAAAMSPSGARRGHRLELGGGRQHGLAAADDLEQDPCERDRQEPGVQPEQEHTGGDQALPRVPGDRRQTSDVQEFGYAGPARRDRDDRDDPDERIDGDDLAGTHDVIRYAGDPERRDERDTPRDLREDRRRERRESTPMDDLAEGLLEMVDRPEDVWLLLPPEALEDRGNEAAEEAPEAIGG